MYFVVVARARARDTPCEVAVLTPPGVRVRRKAADALLCRAEYALRPGFGAGDAVYVDKPYTCPALPAELDAFEACRGAPATLLALRTAQRDKHAGRFGKRARFVKFDVHRVCVALVCYDARATSLPTWLGARACGWRRLVSRRVRARAPCGAQRESRPARARAKARVTPTRRAAPRQVPGEPPLPCYDHTHSD